MSDRHPLWEVWIRAVIRHPYAVIGISLSITAILGLVVVSTPADLSFTGMMDNRDPEVIAYRDSIRVFGANSSYLLLLEGDPDKLRRVSERLIDELPRHVELERISASTDPAWVIDRSPWFWPDALFDSVLEAAGDSGPAPLTVQAVEAADRFIRRSLRPSERALLVTMEPFGDPLDMAMGGRHYRQIARATEAILEQEGGDVTAGFTGIGPMGAQDQNEVFTRVLIVTPITFVAVLILLTGVERRLSRVLMAGLALGSSTIIAFGLVGLVLGKLTITSTFFGMLLLGLGIDFGIHLLVALRDGRARGLSPEEALAGGVQSTGTAIVLGGGSTVLAFAVVAMVPEPGMRDMALTALFGLVAALILMLSMLPAGWLLLERRRRGADLPSKFHLPGLRPVVGLSLAYPRTVIALGLAVAVIGMAAVPRYKLESDLKKIISRKVPALEVEKRLREIYGIAPMTYLAAVDSLDQARAWSEALRKLPEIAEVTSAADFILDDSEERKGAMEATLSKEAGSNGDGVNALRDRLRRALELGPVTVEQLPASLSSGIVGKDGALALRIVPKENILDARVLGGQIARLRAIAPTTTGIPVIAKMFIIGRRDYVPILMPAIFIVVLLVLTVAFRDWRDVVLGLLPVTVGTFAAFGVFFWFGMQFSILTTVVLPVILGLGVDDGIHVVERLRRYRSRTDEVIHEAVEGVGRAIFLTTATTSVSFFGLLFTDHAGMESIGRFMLIGVPICFVTSVTMLPAAAKLLAKKDSR